MLSMCPFSDGEPGAMQNGFIPTVAGQARTPWPHFGLVLRADVPDHACVAIRHASRWSASRRF